MDFKEAFEMVKDYEWFYETNDVGVSLTLGGKGILALKFMPDGTIDFPTNVGFIPEECHHWDFDEQQQKILVYGVQGEVEQTLSLPVREGATLVMDAYGKHEHFRVWDAIFKKSNLQVAPDPQSDHGSMILAYQYDNQTQLGQLVENLGLNVHCLDENPQTWQGIQEIFDYLIEHPYLKKVAIMFDLDFAANPFESFDSTNDNQLVFDDQQSFIRAPRDLMLEMLGKFLIDLNHEAFEHKLMDDDHYEQSLMPYLKENFGERLKQCDK